MVNLYLIYARNVVQIKIIMIIKTGMRNIFLIFYFKIQSATIQNFDVKFKHRINNQTLVTNY